MWSVGGRPGSVRSWMFWCKEIVIGQVFVPHANVFVAKKLLSRMLVPHVLFHWNCVHKKSIIYFREEREQKSYPLKMVTGPKECRTDISARSVQAPRKFSLTNGHVTQIIIDYYVDKRPLSLQGARHIILCATPPHSELNYYSCHIKEK